MSQIICVRQYQAGQVKTPLEDFPSGTQRKASGSFQKKASQLSYTAKSQDKRFVPQMDEAKDSNIDCLLITYVRITDGDDF